METLKDVINYIIGIVNIGAAARITFCFLRWNANPDDSMYVKRIKHVIYFVIFANSVWVIKSIATNYFK